MRGTMVFVGLLAGMFFGGEARAGAPHVAADITPVHSLVAQVMKGIGTPDLIVRPGASPHVYALRPSEAAALERADVVFWVGEALTPWLEPSLDALAPDAAHVELMAVDGTELHQSRRKAVFGAEHQDTQEHDGEEGAAHEDDHGEGHAHSHDGIDPHAWLSPANAALWLDAIAAQLAQIDPENAAAYTANARDAKTALAGIEAKVRGLLAPVAGRRIVVFHDAYQYFEVYFGLDVVGAIALSDASDPGPARIAELRGALAEAAATCVFAEPQFNPGLIAAVTDESPVETAVLDPLGATLTPGPDLYGELLVTLAQAVAECG